jgi:hypothetical protein
MTEYGRIHTDGSRSGGQPVVARQKAHTAMLEVLAEWGIEPRSATPRQLTVATTEALCRAIEQTEAKCQHAHDQGYYDGSTHPIVRHDALREALVDLLHAVCGEKGFAEAVRRDSGRIYPWPALDLAEAKAIRALEQSK